MALVYRDAKIGAALVYDDVVYSPSSSTTTVSSDLVLSPSLAALVRSDLVLNASLAALVRSDLQLVSTLEAESSSVIISLRRSVTFEGGKRTVTFPGGKRTVEF